MAPSLCANGCGFYGSAANNNFCSKCYKDHLKQNSDHQSETIEGAAEGENNNLMNKPCAFDQSPVIADLCADVAAMNVTAADDSATSIKKIKKNRCKSCNKKVGLTGFECRCGDLFCGMHRYPEEHSCTVDFKKIGRQVLVQQNPLVVADKLENRV